MPFPCLTAGFPSKITLLRTLARRAAHPNTDAATPGISHTHHAQAHHAMAMAPPAFGPPPPPVAAQCMRVPTALTATPHLGAVLSVAAPPAGMAATLALLASLARTAFALLGLAAGAAGIAYGGGYGGGGPPQSLPTAALALDLPPAPAAPTGTALLPFAGPGGGTGGSTPLDSRALPPSGGGPIAAQAAAPPGSEVPEPASLPLLLLAVPAVLLARRPR